MLKNVRKMILKLFILNVMVKMILAPFITNTRKTQSAVVGNLFLLQLKTYHVIRRVPLVIIYPLEQLNVLLVFLGLKGLFFSLFFLLLIIYSYFDIS